MQRRVVTAVLAVVMAAGLACTGLAAFAGSGPDVSVIILGGSGAAVSPVTATPPAGGSVQFRNAGSQPFVVTRDATPLAFATTVEPSSASVIFAVPSATGSYGYTAQPHSTSAFLGADSPGPATGAVIAVQPSAGASPSDSSAGTPSPTFVAQSFGTAPQTQRPSPRRSAKARPGESGSASPSDTATPIYATLAPGEILPAPVGEPSFGTGSPVPLPVLPTSVDSGSSGDQASGGGGSAATPLASSSAAPARQIVADAPRPGPSRGRGLPLALALVFLLGVGGAVARVLRRTGRPSVRMPSVRRLSPRRAGRPGDESDQQPEAAAEGDPAMAHAGEAADGPDDGPGPPAPLVDSSGS